MTSKLLTVNLEKLVYGGDAMGYVPDSTSGTERQVIFVPFGLPGERVRVRVVEEKRGYLRGELVEVLETSSQRIPPRCKHFSLCGGCHYQHLSYAEQLAAKTDILRDQLIRIGHIEDPPVKPIVPSPYEWNYRNHIQFHLAKGGKLGYVDVHSEKRLPITECHLPELALNNLWPDMQFDPSLGIQRVGLRLGLDEEVMLVLESEEPETPELEIEADISVVHLSGEDMVVMAGDDHLVMKVNERLFRVSAASFFQVNTAMTGKMIEYLLAKSPLTPESVVLDVYCGVGLFSAFLAPRVERVIGIESSPSACVDFSVNLDEFDNVELYEAPAEDALPTLDVEAATVLVDPPRAGLDKRATEALLALAPATLAYISCDPSTLGRDARRLINGGYRLVEVTPFDLFPQTYHIESISLFRKLC